MKTFKQLSEELNELKASTLQSYVKKATPAAKTYETAAKRAFARALKTGDKGQHALTSLLYQKRNKRISGAARASEKLSEAELHELKKSTLKSYVKKAEPSAMSHEVAGYKAARKAGDKSLGTKERTTLSNFAKSMYRKSDLRSRGIQKAQHRLKQSS
jgi:hypothetical protein